MNQIQARVALAPELRARAREKMPRAMLSGMTLSVWAEFIPDAPAILSEHGNRTFRELNARANQLARALRARGLGEGDGIALLCGNRPEFAEVTSAARRAGMRITPINWHLTPDEAAYIVNDCDAKAVIGDVRFVEALTQIAAKATAATVRLAVGGAVPGFESYDGAVAEHDASDLTDPKMGTQMLYTSGTTGRPKGVHRAAGGFGAAPGVMAAVPGATTYEPGISVHLCTGPLYHAAPLAYSLTLPLFFGAGVVLMDGWDAEQTLALVDRYRVTHTHMVPTMFHRLLALPDAVRSKHDLSSLSMVLHGAAPCPISVKRRLIEWLGPIVYEYYGATEGSATTVDAETWLKKPGTVGKPPTEDLVRILDDAGESVAAGVPGTVYIKAPAQGRFNYYKDEHKTGQTYRGDYFTLGDVGYLDEDGYLFLTDRSTNLIISGGVNIYPAEIEAALLEHPAVADTGVIGVPNEEWGEEVKAVVELQRGFTASPELAQELIAHCRARLASFKCPRSVDFTTALPRQENGKLYKQALRQRYRTTKEA